MSGHSHAKNVARQKEAGDKKKSTVFSKLLKAISAAARAGDPNPDFNPTLRAAVEKAKDANVPKDNIERAIKKSSSASTQELVIEAHGPEGVAIIITALTDNSNRTLREVRHLLEANGAKWAEPGSVRWAFIQEGNIWKAKFPQSISKDSQSKLAALISILEEHEDIVSIFPASS